MVSSVLKHEQFLKKDVLKTGSLGEDSGDLGSVPSRDISNTLKMVLDTYLLNTQQYKVRIKGKVEQSRERSGALPYTWVS